MENDNPTVKNDIKVALNDFSVNFLKTYHQAEEKYSNLFCSPISLAGALSLLLTGANGSTQQELVDLLGYNDLIKNQELNVAFKKVRIFFTRFPIILG